MTQYEDRVEKQRNMLIAEKWARGVKSYHSHSLESIENVLLEFVNNEQKINQYINEFKGLRSHLIDGMNLTNKQNLSTFKLTDIN